MQNDGSGLTGNQPGGVVKPQDSLDADGPGALSAPVDQAAVMRQVNLAIANIPPPPPKESPFLKLTRRLNIALVILVLLTGLAVAYDTLRNKEQTKNTPAGIYGQLDLPLNDLSFDEQAGLITDASVAVNGQLRLNDGLVITPSGQPSAPVAGQLYYDQASNRLLYFDGARFQAVASADSLLGLQGQVGALQVAVGQLQPVQQVTVPVDIARQGSTNTFTANNTFTGGLGATSLTVSGNASLGAATASSLTLGAPLGVGSGGTGVTALPNNGVLIGQGSSPIAAVTAGGAGLCLVSTSGAPVFQTCPGASSLGGTGTANQLAFFTDGSTLASDSNLFWDDTNNRLGIGTSTPGSSLDTSGDINTATGYRVNGVAGATVTCAGGQFVQNAVIQGGIVTGGSCVAAGSGSGVTTVGTIDSQTKSSDGAVIAGVSLYLQTADVTNPGLVSVGAQTFAGAKTFNGAITASGGISGDGSGLTNLNASSLAIGTVASARVSGNYTGITGTGALTAGSIAVGFGTINTASTITGTILNATTGFQANGVSGAAITCAGGQFLQNPVVAGGIVTGGTCAVPAGDGGVTAVGVIDSQVKSANGGVIAGATLYFQTADATNPGLVSTGTQTFAGDKTFNDNAIFGDSTNDRLTLMSHLLGGSPIVLQGATDNGFATTLAVTDPTANNTITLPNASGTVAVSATGNIALSAAGQISLTGQVGVANGGTGAASFTTNGVLYGNGTGAIGVTAAGATNQCLRGNTGSAPTWGSCDIAAGDGGVTAVGAIDSQTKSANGAVIVGTDIFFQTADVASPGLVSIGTQTFAGNKTFAGNLTLNGNANLIKPTSNSTTAFQVQPSGSTTPVFNVDTTNSRVGVGTNAPGYALDVVGDINTSTGFRVGGVAGAATTCTGGQFLQNAVVVGGIVTGGTCAAPGGGDGGVTTVGTIDSQTKSANGGVIVGTDLFFQTADATNPGLVSTGTQTFAGSKTFIGNNTLFKPGTNSTTAFQIQPAASATPVLNVDTVNSFVGVGTANPEAKLEVAGGLLNSGAGFNFNIMAYDTSAAGQGVGGGIGFTGEADTKRTFAAIQGFHESSTASNYAGALRFMTRTNGQGTLNEQARIGSNGATLFKNSANSTTAFQIQPAGSSTSVFSVDTITSSVGIGTNAPGYPLDVVGSINTSVGYRVGGTLGSTTTCTGGQLLQNAVVAGGIITGGSCIAPVTGGVTTVGTLDSQTKSANGAVIAGTSIYMQTADATNPGLVSTGSQTFAGAKTFNGAITASGGISGDGSGLTNLNASNLASGTVANARISGSYTGITGTGALVAGSIGNGFGTINTSNNITTSATMQGSTINATTGFQANGVSGTTTTCTGGQLLQNAAVAGGIVTGGTCAADAGVTTIGTIDSQTKSANGAVIAGTSIYMQTADATNPGLVSTGTQTFAGNKTFNGSITSLNDISGRAVTSSGYLTTSTGSGFAGQYTKLATCTITAQFQECRATAMVLGFENGAGTSEYRATVDWRVKQQAAMGGAPAVGVDVYDVNQITDTDFTAVTVTNTAGSTVVELWGQIDLTFTTWSVNPIVNVNTRAVWHATQGFSASLPAGTQTVGGYADEKLATLVVNTSITGATINATTGFRHNGVVGATTTCTGGQLLQNAVVAGGIITGGTCAADAGVTTVGALDSQTKSANGAVIVGTSIYLQTADATNPGLVSTGSQTFAGSKTFTGNATLFKPGSDSTTAFQIQPASSATPIFNVDTTNGRIGIGTATPQYLVHATGSQNGIQRLSIQNTSTGSSAQSQVQAMNDAGYEASMSIASSTFSGYGALVANGAVFYSNGVGGLALMADATGGVIKFATNGNAEKVRIDADGDLGIGTTAPSTMLQVGAFNRTSNADISIDTQAASQAILEFRSAGSTTAEIYRPGGSTDLRIWGATLNDDIATFNTSNGRVGIGTTAPSQKLEVVGNAKTTSGTTVASQGFEGGTFVPTSPGTWTTGGTTNWTRETTNCSTAPEGSACARSGTLSGDNMNTWLDLDYTFAADGLLKFHWKTDTEYAYDILMFCVDNDASCSNSADGDTKRISGDTGWVEVVYPVSAGAHSFRWKYEKDGGFSDPVDRAWVDNIRIIEGQGNVLADGKLSGTVLNAVYGNIQENLGIGNFTVGEPPAGTLHLWGTGVNGSNASLHFGDTGNLFIKEYGADDTDELHIYGNDGIIFGSAGGIDMLFDGSGNLGIGTAAPGEELDVEGQIQFNLDGNAGDTTIGVCKNTSDSSGVQTGTEFRDCNGTASDIAEFYPTQPGVESGDIVAITDDEFTYTEEVNDLLTGAYVNRQKQTTIPVLKKGVRGDGTRLLSIVSTNPYQSLGRSIIEAGASNPLPVALNGRVPVKVNDENGPILAGDGLTASSTPGVAMKASPGDPVLATALGGFSGTDGKVMAFVRSGTIEMSTNFAEQVSDLQGQIAGMGSIINTGSLHTDSLTVTGNATIQGDLTVGGTAKLKDLELSGHLITTGSTPAVTLEAAAGLGQQAQVTVSGTDTAGTITLTAGSNPAADKLLKLTFANPYGEVPHIVLTAVGKNGVILQPYVEEPTTDSFFLGAGMVPEPGKTYQFNYHVMQ